MAAALGWTALKLNFHIKLVCSVNDYSCRL